MTMYIRGEEENEEKEENDMHPILLKLHRIQYHQSRSVQWPRTQEHLHVFIGGELVILEQDIFKIFWKMFSYR